MRWLALCGALALTVAPAAAQQVPPTNPTPYTRAIAAGYKAAMYCSGIFTAGRTSAQIDADELNGIYPEYDAVVQTLSAVIERERRVVTVAFDPALPPRRAGWRPNIGCQLEPIGSVAPFVGYAGSGVVEEPADKRGWPQGDAGIAPNPGGALAGAVDRAFDRSSYGAGKTVGLVVVHRGRIVAERYGDGWGPLVANRTWSVGKSIAGTVIGVAAHGYPVDPRQPTGMPEWSAPNDPRAAITLDQLLRMSSGLHNEAAGNRTDAIYFGGALVTEEATRRLVEAPAGTRFLYSNSDILLAMRAIHAQLGEAVYVNLPKHQLFDVIGMAHTEAGMDTRHDFIMSSQVWSTARDLARLGQFWLQDGVWQGRRLLPEGWMHYMTTPSGPQPADGPGYGATMWLFGPKQGLPAGSYAAQGNRGQYVMVIPSAKLVIVRRGEDPGAARFDIAKFSADVLAAVRR